MIPPIIDAAVYKQKQLVLSELEYRRGPDSMGRLPKFLWGPLHPEWPIYFDEFLDDWDDDDVVDVEDVGRLTARKHRPITGLYSNVLNAMLHIQDMWFIELMLS